MDLRADWADQGDMLHCAAIAASLSLVLAQSSGPNVPKGGTSTAPALEKPGLTPAAVTKAQLANFYLAVDNAFRTRMMTEGAKPQEVVRFNRRFDEMTLDLLGGNLPKSVDAMIAIERDLNGEDAKPTLCGGLCVRVEPPVWSPGKPMPKVVIRSFQASSNRKPEKCQLEIEATSMTPVPGAPAKVTTITKKQVVDVGSTSILNTSVAMDWGLASAGGETVTAQTFDVTVRVNGAPDFGVSRLIVSPRSLDALREELVRSLNSVPDSEDLRVAIQIARRRVALLSDSPNENNISQIQANYTELPDDVRDEVAALGQGKNPYKKWVGDLWRPIILDANTPIACRVYAPSAAAGTTPLPLVIALHGATGDESMFIDAHAGGIITDLADREGFIVACPATTPFAENAGNFDKLVDQLSADYVIDRKQIFVMGHSMGAVAAGMLGKTRSAEVAGVICFGNAKLPEKGEVKMPPTLVVLGEHDQVCEAEAIRKAAQLAKDRGLPVEVLNQPSFGHTLVVGAALPEAVDWMFERKTAGKGGK